MTNPADTFALEQIARHLGEISEKLDQLLGGKLPRKIQEAAIEPVSFTKEQAQNAVRKVVESRMELEYVNIDPRNAVVYNPLDGKYHASVQIQDGYEKCGVHDSQEAAVAAYVDGQKWLNHNIIDPKDVRVYIAESVPKPEVKYRRI